MALVQILIWLAGFNFSQSCAFFLCTYLLIFSGIHKEMQTLYSLSHKNWLCWEGQGESKGASESFWLPSSLSHLAQLICDSEIQHVMWMTHMEVEYLTPSLKYKHITAGSVHIDTSCVRISDHDPSTREERKATLGKSVPSFSSFLILLRSWNEWV